MVLSRVLVVAAVLHPSINLVPDFSAYLLCLIPFGLYLFPSGIFVSRIDDLKIPSFPFLPACRLGFYFLLGEHSFHLAFEL